MPPPRPWLEAKYALLHGEDSDGRSAAVAAWKAVHVDPEWEVFSFTVCAEGCPWAEVLGALAESAPLGAERVVLAPQADNLLEKAKELPPAVKRALQSPLDGTCLLLVARIALSAGPGRILGSKPFSDWAQQGRVLKVGALEEKEAAAWVEAAAGPLGLRLAPGVAARIAARMGGNPGILRRTLEVLDLLSADRAVTLEQVDQATFRLGEQNLYAWAKAWQNGQAAQALAVLRQALEDDPAAALMLLGQARREAERVCRLAEARRAGMQGGDDLAKALGLSQKQAFLLDGYARVLSRIGPDGAQRLLALVNQTDLDLKGQAISRSVTPMLHLTTALCRAWSN
jgi:DNA polymerase III delta subunit